MVKSAAELNDPSYRILAVITDEIIASPWDVVTLALDGKTLLTEDEQYVVAAQKGRTDLINAVHEVIRDNNISAMYTDLTAR